MQKVTPFLWFDTQAEEAVNFYVSVFKNAKITTVTRYNEEGARQVGQKKGAVMTVAFQLNGQEFVALNGGPMFQFSPAISFVVNCDTQQEIDHFWSKLSEGGQTQPCGWLQDKYGVSWQIVPTKLGDLMSGPNAERVMNALLQMSKIDIAILQNA